MNVRQRNLHYTAVGLHKLGSHREVSCSNVCNVTMVRNGGWGGGGEGWGVGGVGGCEGGNQQGQILTKSNHHSNSKEENHQPVHGHKNEYKIITEQNLRAYNI